MSLFKITPLFSLPFYSSSVDGINDNVKNNVKDLDYGRLDIDNGNISINKYVLNEPQFFKLKQTILEHINYYAKDFLCISDVSFHITNSWVMKHDFGDWSQRHCHTNSVFSGVLYIETDDQSGKFSVITNSQNLFPSLFHPKIISHNIYNSREWSFIPKNNDIYIFPSHLDHEVTPSQSNQTRYCIAFNVYASGILGGDDPSGLSHLELK
jgi:uncharacterized protein (TIGR02466 family)